MGLLYGAAVINTALEPANAKQGALNVLWHAIDASKDMLSLLLVDQYFFGAWTYAIASLAFLPIWLIFWAIPFSSP
jgi:hypothetical protein